MKPPHNKGPESQDPQSLPFRGKTSKEEAHVLSSMLFHPKGRAEKVVLTCAWPRLFLKINNL